MTKYFKIFVLMLAIKGMAFPATAAQPVKYVSSNILTYVQSDDEIIEIEGEEGYFDEYEDETAVNNAQKKGNSKVGDIVTYILLGLILIVFCYAFYWLRHNSVTLDNHPIIYTSLKVSKFSAIMGFVACVTFMICSFGVHLRDLYIWLIIGGFGIVILLYAIYISYKSYEALDSTSTKISITIVSIALSLLIGYAMLYLGMAVLVVYIIWFLIKDKLGWDKYVLSDGTEIKRINSLSNRYKDNDGNTYERLDDGSFVKI